ncbi:RNA-binding protein [Patescibacteria group bacterium]|nr:RNA-binding protein [Patescibacteria group bacterium]
MGKKLYVGSLSYNTSEEGMREAFGRAGAVESVQIIIDKMSGRSKGFGFVEMASDEEAQAAIQMWDGAELDGRTLVVNEARPLEARPPRQSSGGYSGGGRGGGFGGGNRSQSRW